MSYSALLAYNFDISLCKLGNYSYNSSMIIENWDLIPYKNALDKQMELLDKVAGGEEDHLIFCRHPSVVTLGKATEESDLRGWQGESFKVQRGGRATYHGPEQLVVYPIINLNRHKKDLHLHLRKLEKSLANCLKKHYDLETKIAQEDATGVWIGSKKIASIGIAVRKWTTYHGMAVNLNHDPMAFTGISPCGFQTNTMTSLEDLLEQKIDYNKFSSQIETYLIDEFKLNSDNV
jgi:lipoate-protein ligase B